MIKFLCNQCGKTFNTIDNLERRMCPECGSIAEEHSLMSSKEECDDVLVTEGQKVVCEA